MAPGRTKQQEKLPDGCAKWSATDFEMHREIILVKLTKGVAIPEGELSPNISDGERKLFRSLARKEGTTPQLQEWSLGPGKEHACERCASRKRPCEVCDVRSACLQCESNRRSCSRTNAYRQWRVIKSMDEDADWKARGGSTRFNEFVRDMYAAAKNDADRKAEATAKTAKGKDKAQDDTHVVETSRPVKRKAEQPVASGSRTRSSKKQRDASPEKVVVDDLGPESKRLKLTIPLRPHPAPAKPAPLPPRAVKRQEELLGLMSDPSTPRFQLTGAPWPKPPARDQETPGSTEPESHTASPKPTSTHGPLGDEREEASPENDDARSPASVEEGDRRSPSYDGHTRDSSPLTPHSEYGTGERQDTGSPSLDKWIRGESIPPVTRTLLDEAKERERELRETIQTTTTRAEAAEGRLVNMESEVRSVRAQVRHLQAQRKAQADPAVLKAQLHEAEELAKESQGKEAAMRADLDRTRTQLITLEESSVAEKEALKREVESQKSTIENLRAAMEDATTRYEASIKDLETKVDTETAAKRAAVDLQRTTLEHLNAIQAKSAGVDIDRSAEHPLAQTTGSYAAEESLRRELQDAREQLKALQDAQHGTFDADNKAKYLLQENAELKAKLDLVDVSPGSAAAPPEERSAISQLSSYIGGMTTQLASTQARLHEIASLPSIPEDVQKYLFDSSCDLRFAFSDAVSFVSRFTRFRGHGIHAAAGARHNLKGDSSAEAGEDEVDEDNS